MATITKKELIDSIAGKTGITQSRIKPIVQEFLHEIVTELGKNNRLEFRDFGVFEVKRQSARAAHNPKTLERIEVPAKRKVKFKMGRIMKEGMKAKGGKKQ